LHANERESASHFEPDSLNLVGAPNYVNGNAGIFWPRNLSCIKPPSQFQEVQKLAHALSGGDKFALFCAWE
jgi:hypothetical protein